MSIVANATNSHGKERTGKNGKSNRELPSCALDVLISLNPFCVETDKQIQLYTNLLLLFECHYTGEKQKGITINKLQIKSEKRIKLHPHDMTSFSRT